MLEIPGRLRKMGCRKITFVGGEPTLNPYLPEFLEAAKDVDLTTMIVTNGTQLTPAYQDRIADYTDWIALSLDSQFESIEKALGRGWGHHVENTLQNIALVKDSGIHLKINTVVTRLNVDEDMSDLVKRIAPERWKAFQVLSVRGQNDVEVEPLLITSEEFSKFKKTHEKVQESGLSAVFEDSQAMLGSYLMLDPSGQFFSNTTGEHLYTYSIFDDPMDDTPHGVDWNFNRFLDRGGLYSWSPEMKVFVENWGKGY